MKILLSSRLFHPSLGGSQKSAELLAREFINLGQEVKVVTQTIGSNTAADGSLFPFDVIRQPNPIQLLKLVHWCDVYFHNGISLRDAWPLLIIRKPWIIRHLSWLPSVGISHSSLRGRLKHFIIRFSVSTAVSKAIAAHLRYPSTVIPSPYLDDLFRFIPEINRDKELIFLGRLVSDKGVGLLLEALFKLRDSGLKPKLTIIGQGSEEYKLHQKAIDLGIQEQVYFMGTKVGEELVEILNEHQIMIVPSRWNEPSGGVATEGIACGCVVVGSEGGGLKDMIGPCGLTFPNGNVNALTEILLDLLKNPDKIATYRAKAAKHLLSYKKKTVAKAYLQVLEAAVQ
ncbi:MAG: glycosyltransferase family 4 protein [Coleofasciculus sp. B1-GNL1-01]|uniref:glycosyltransferase family 4 protein n=1 Tax=Coleofasciculus sp. B1-GNL1-01 TaxID=3068484 RepID=UPI0032F804FC